MKTLFIVFGLLISTTVFGNGLTEIGKAGQCTQWVSNAMYGATQFMRGASREVQYIPKSTLAEMLTRVGTVGSDKLYILANESYTDDERGFLEESTLFGYDAMSKWKSRNADRLPSHAEWQRNFAAMCMEHEAI